MLYRNSAYWQAWLQLYEIKEKYEYTINSHQNKLFLCQTIKFHRKQRNWKNLHVNTYRSILAHVFLCVHVNPMGICTCSYIWNHSELKCHLRNRQVSADAFFIMLTCHLLTNSSPYLILNLRGQCLFLDIKRNVFGFLTFLFRSVW